MVQRTVHPEAVRVKLDPGEKFDYTSQEQLQIILERKRPNLTHLKVVKYNYTLGTRLLILWLEPK